MPDKDNLEKEGECSCVGGDERRRFDQIESYAATWPPSLIVGRRLPEASWESTPTWGHVVALARSQRELEAQVKAKTDPLLEQLLNADEEIERLRRALERGQQEIHELTLEVRRLARQWVERNARTASTPVPSESQNPPEVPQVKPENLP